MRSKVINVSVRVLMDSYQYAVDLSVDFPLHPSTWLHQMQKVKLFWGGFLPAASPLHFQIYPTSSVKVAGLCVPGLLTSRWSYWFTHESPLGFNKHYSSWIRQLDTSLTHQGGTFPCNSLTYCIPWVSLSQQTKERLPRTYPLGIPT